MSEDSGGLDKKLKTALDETRLLILGGQILLGFQFVGVFQERFKELGGTAHVLDVVALLLMVSTIALLIAPSLQHRIVEEGRTTERIFLATGQLAELALLPFALSLGIDLFIIFQALFGTVLGIVPAVLFVTLALTFWYALAYWRKRACKGEPDGRPRPQ
jgi:Family of unknown function (DUF6328)